jgi:hypothetical protein
MTDRKLGGVVAACDGKFFTLPHARHVASFLMAHLGYI